MPTILINTNLASTVNGSSKSVDEVNAIKENFHDEFKKEINAIITKLLEKSETMDSFLIKYDIDDILLKKNDNNKHTSSKCICERLTHLFSEVLTSGAPSNPQSTSESSNTRILQNSEAQNLNPTSNEIQNIYTELKDIRKYQFDLFNKFNVVMDKLNCKDGNNSSVYRNRHYSNSQKENSNQQKYRHSMNLRNTSNKALLTGAKKRKNSAFTKNGQDDQNQNEISQEDFVEEDGMLEDNNQNLIEDEYEVDSLTNKNHLDNLSEKLNDDYENVQSRDCPSRFSTLTSSSKFSTTRINSKEPNFNGDYNDSDEMDNPAQFSENEISPKQSMNNEKSLMQSKSCTPPITKVEQKDPENEFIDEIPEQEDQNGMDNHEEYLNENEHQNSNSKDTPFNGIASNQRNNYTAYSIYQNLQHQKLQTSHKAERDFSNSKSHMFPKQPQMAPNQKFRFVNQSPTPASNDFPQQSTYSPILHNTKFSSQLQQQQQSLKSSSTYNQNYLNRSGNSTKPPISTYSNNSSVQEMKYKSSQNSNEQTPNLDISIKNEMATDIDINEVFKDGGPRFLQMELYKNFKPPICIVQDKYYIDNLLASSAYSKSKSRRNFAAHLAKLVFTPRERLESNCNGRFGKKALDTTLLSAIRNTLFKYYPCKQSTLVVNGDTITSGDYDENNVWLRDCIPAIDESNRVLKKQLIAWYKKNCLSHSNNVSGNMTNSELMNTSSNNYVTSKRGYNFDGHLGGLNSEKSNMNDEEYEENMNDEDYDEEFDEDGR